MTHAIQ
jgi:AP-1 complex subunit beta-1